MISLIGVGRVGITAAFHLMLMELDDLMLIDIVEGLPQGHALDLKHAIGTLGLSIDVNGSNDYSSIEGSRIIIVTAGLPRKAGMTREDLALQNARIMSDIAENIKRYAPDSIVILTTNPVDAMAYVMYKKLGFERERVIGYGWLDTGRYRYYLSKALGVSPSEISAFVIGMHGEKMLPLDRLSTFSGVPINELISRDLLENIKNETVKAGAKIIEQRGFSSNYGPAVGLALMSKWIYNDSKSLCVGSVYLDGEYGYKDVMANVPIILGSKGAEKIIELPLNDDEKKLFGESVKAVKDLIDSIPRDLYG